MTQLCCYRVWDGSLQQFRRNVLILSVIDLVVVSAIIVFVGISLYNVSFVEQPDPDPKDGQPQSLNNDNENEMQSKGAALCDTSEDGNCEPSSENATTVPLNQTLSGRFFPNTPYFQVVGFRIAKSIQLIIFTCQLLVTVILVRGLLRLNTLSMRTWLIVTEILSTIILIVLVLYLFGDFEAGNIIALILYLIFQFIMIRTVAQFIRRTEIELTQFGSIVDFQ